MRLRRKPRYRRKFTSLRFYLRVHELLGRYAFKLPVRRFVTGLFAEVDLSGAAWAALREHQHHHHHHHHHQQQQQQQHG